ncbi:MAG TPA: polyphosphate polymerase domain-containing protein [Verrucomicrobiales bacterium]|nr:polyphosphate polymerase domain-containing protein [Verrucomicrobiales bacterium]
MIATSEQPAPPSSPPVGSPAPSPDASAPPKRQGGPSRKGAKDVVIERFEQKFVLHPRLVPQVRNYMEPFTVADPNGKGDIPEYITTTLQLDTPTMDLALAKERKSFGRFKLRIRTYGTDSNPGNPVFFELKRKIGMVIVKSRARMKRAQFTPSVIPYPETAPMLKSPKENNNLLEFCRITKAIGATPKMLIRYIRESYFGANDDYARITFDRRISYRPTREWRLPGEEVADFKYWRPMDTQTGLRREYAGYIFELKAMRDTPTWMLELVRRFNLSNTGFCKYAAAWRLETLFRGFSYAAASENTTATPNWI